MLNKNVTEKILKERLQELKANTSIVEKRMNMYSENSLKVRKDKNGFSYCIVDKNSRKTKYVRKENIKIARLIAQRDYDYSYLRIAKKEIEDIEKILEKRYVSKIEGCYSDINEGRKILVRPFEMSDDEYVKRWMNIPYKIKEFNESDTTEYYTDKGERVRSKSEVIIANLLCAMNIPYKYECPLQLEQTIIYPDFTILDMTERREKYLEHFGMMGDPEYVSNMLLKVSMYERNGIFIGDRLICSFESTKRPLNNNVLKSKLYALLPVTM